MADDPGVRTTQTSDLNQEIARTSDLLADAGRAEKNYQRLSNSIHKVRLQNISAEVKAHKRLTNDVAALYETQEKSAAKLDRLQTKAISKSKNANIAQIQVIKSQAANLITTTRLLEDAGHKFADVTESYRVAIKTHAIASKQHDENLKKLKKGLGDGSLKQEEYNAALSQSLTVIDDAKNEMTSLESQAISLSKTISQQRKIFVEQEAELNNLTTSARQADREYRKLQGGVKGASAVFEELAENKITEWIGKVKGVAGVTLGFTKLGTAVADVGKWYRETNQLAITMGDTNRRSFGNFAQGAMEAQKMTSHLIVTSTQLDYTLDQMREVLDKVRVGIRFDRDGRLGVKAMEDLTDEVALFARTTNIDLAEATAMATTRIHHYGMTAKETVADMTLMRNSLLAMSQGITGTNIPLDDMVKLIDEASRASQSYIVDTRLMTQAMRGAANQSLKLGATKQQAMAMAEGMGKVLSNAPAYINIPAGKTLLAKLKGPNFEDFLKQFDENTRKQLRNLREDVIKGNVNPYYAAQELMKRVGSTQEGVAAQLDALTQFTPTDRLDQIMTVLQKDYQIADMGVARQTAKIIQQYKKNEKEFKNEMYDLSVVLSGQSAQLEEVALSTVLSAKTKIEKLEKFGISKKQAEEYVETLNKGSDKMIAIQKDINAEREKGTAADQSKIKAFEQELDKERAKHSMAAAEAAIAPGNRLFNEINKKIKEQSAKPGAEKKETLAIDAKFNKEQLESVGIKGWKNLGKRLGVDLEKNKDVLDKMYAEGFTKQDADALHSQDMQVAQEAVDSAKAPEGHFLKLEGLLGMGGPIFDAIVGLGLIFLGSRSTKALGGLLRGGGTGGLLEGLLGKMSPKITPWIANIGKKLGMGPTTGGIAGPLSKGITEIKDVGKDVVKDAAKKVAKDVGIEVAKDTAKEVAKDVGKEVVKDAAKEVAKEVAKDVGKEVAKDVAVAGANTLSKVGIKEAGIFAKYFGKTASKGVPVLGTAITTALATKDAYDIYKKYKTGKATKREVAKESGGVVGTMGGAAAGATIGSVIPGLGTLVGGAIGALVGGLGGNFLGEAVGDKVGEYLDASKPATPTSLTGADNALNATKVPESAFKENLPAYTELNVQSLNVPTSLAGTPTTPPDATATPPAGYGVKRARQSAFAANQELTARKDSVTASGDVLLRIKDFFGIVSDHKNASQQVHGFAK